MRAQPTSEPMQPPTLWARPRRAAGTCWAPQRPSGRAGSLTLQSCAAQVVAAQAMGVLLTLKSRFYEHLVAGVRIEPPALRAERRTLG